MEIISDLNCLRRTIIEIIAIVSMMLSNLVKGEAMITKNP